MTTVALPSTLRPGYPHVSLIEDRSIAFLVTTSLLSLFRKRTLRWINIGEVKATTIKRQTKFRARGDSLWEARKAVSATALSSRKPRLWVHAKQPRKFLGSLRLWILR